MQKITKYLIDKLKITEETSLPQILKELTIDGIVDYVKSDKCKKVIVMAGAGISTCEYLKLFKDVINRYKT